MIIGDVRKEVTCGFECLQLLHPAACGGVFNLERSKKLKAFGAVLRLRCFARNDKPGFFRLFASSSNLAAL